MYSLETDGFTVLSQAAPKKLIFQMQRELKEAYDSIGVKSSIIESNIIFDNQTTSEEIIQLDIDTIEKTKSFKKFSILIEEIISLKLNKKLSPLKWNALRQNTKDNKKNVFWHQDIQTPYESFQNYYKLKFYTAWIPVSNIEINNGISIIQGSHKPSIIDINHYRRDYGVPAKHVGKKIIKLNCQLGDIVILDNFLFHKSTNNETDKVRISIDLRFSSSEKQDFAIENEIIKRKYLNQFKRKLFLLRKKLNI
tara:strand:+ start:629 stop:1384 length:756 start_codon:yes stop_codon:yes gene_type:complete